MENEIILTKDQLINLIKIADIEVNPDFVTSNDISRALIAIEKKLNFFNYPLSFFTAESLNVLIIDDMELSIYQLTSMLRKIGMNVFVSRTKEEAVAEIKKKHFDYIIVDLFLPDAKDGFEVIEFANRFKQENGRDYKLLAISGTDDKAIIQDAYKHGVDEFVPKQPNWHEKIMKFIALSTSKVNSEEFNKYFINEDICVFTIYKINNQKYIDSIYKEVNAVLLSGKRNIVFNMEYIKIFSDNYAGIFAEIYKIALAKEGQFVIVKPSTDVRRALDFVFLTGIIPIYETLEDAVGFIEMHNFVD